MDSEEMNILQRHLSDFPIKLGALAKDLGIDVFQSSLKPGISGLIEPSKTSLSGYQIKINRHEAVARQRFTLAHEIAHFLLHKDFIRNGVIDNTLYRSSLSNKQEIEANKLASRIVMPDSIVKDLRQKYADLSLDEMVSRMSDELRVSEPAMRIKLGV
jgi:Zn-dependent peptidase ImmA (M78 family)